MTFSTKVKQEIISSSSFAGSELSLLCGIIITAGSIVLSSKQMSFSITTDNDDLIKFSQKLILKMFPQSSLEIQGNLRKTLNLDSSSANNILFDCGVLSRDERGRLNLNLAGDNHLRIERDGRLAFLAGTFLGGGTVSVPTDAANSGYHMEWSFNSSNQAEVIQEILASEDIFTKMVQRGDEYIVYLKVGEQISNVVGLMGAAKSYLSLESKLVDRSMRNLINRQSNCINANIDKAVVAGIKQVEAIKTIDTTIGLNNLPNSLKQMAELRLKNPEATLQELADNMGVSKSAVNLRLRKLMQISKELGEADD